MSKIIFLLIFITLPFVANLQAEDQICTYMTGKPGPLELERFATSCKLQKIFASDSDVQQAHRKNIHRKLAERLAKQIEQNSEELAIMANYFSSNEADLLMNDKNVANECQLKKVSEIEKCPPDKNNPDGKKSNDYDEKLALLKSFLPKKKNAQNYHSSLESIISEKFSSDLTGDKSSSCPLNKKSGGFLLQSQIDEKSAKLIIERLLDPNIKDNTTLISSYAQLKFLQDAKNPELMKDFIEHLRKKTSDVSAAKHLANFFKVDKNQVRMSPALVSRCSQMNTNLRDYLCHDLKELGSLDPTVSSKMFSMLTVEEDLEDQYEVDLKDPSVLTAYGMQCLLKEKKAKTNKSIQIENKNAPTLDNWFNNFTNNIRAYESSEVESAGQVALFCSYYECKDQAVMSVPSCRSGGPISVLDMGKAFGCETNSINCSDVILKSINLLTSLENTNDKKSVASSNSSAGVSIERKSGKIPAFAENYLGVEGSLRALGRPITAETIAEKTKEHEERAKLDEKRLTIKYEEPAAASQISKHKELPLAEASTAQQESSPRSQNSSTEFATGRTFGDSSLTPKFADKKHDETKKSAVVAKSDDGDNTEEVKRIRAEMEKLMSDMKSSGQDTSAIEQDLADVKAYANKKGSQTLSTATNRAEEDRLRRWDQTLRDRSRDLDQYKRDLDDRNYAERNLGRDDSQSRSSASKAAGSASTTDNMGRDSASSSTSSGSLSNGVRLTTSGAAGASKGEQKAETAAIIQAGKESSTMSTEELTKLSPENLKSFGIDASKPFTLRVNFNNKTYDVPVKNFLYKGNVILGPIVDKKNKELNEFLLKSPLFKEYYNYQIQKEVSR